jgi:hypothetical protein
MTRRRSFEIPQPIYHPPSRRGAHGAPRELTMTSMHRPASDAHPRGEIVPYLRLCGQWLQRIGFKHGDRVVVSAEQKRLVITIAAEES